MEPSSPESIISSSILNSAALDDMDPSVSEGFVVIYDRECPIELRTALSSSSSAFSSSTASSLSSSESVAGPLEALKVKVLVKGDDQDTQVLRIELSSEADLFFHYQCTIDASAFRSMKDSQKLLIGMQELPNTVVRCLNNCIKEPHAFIAVLILSPSIVASLQFFQNMEYKFVELLQLAFQRSSEETIKAHITFRYNALKSRLATMQARLQDVNALVKIKNPSLLLQLQRTPSRGSGVSLTPTSAFSKK